MNLWTLIDERKVGLEIYNDKTKINEKVKSRIKLVISMDREILQGGFSFEKQKKCKY